jgi:hypothetical protein
MLMLYIQVFVSEYNTLVRTSYALERLVHALDVFCPKWVMKMISNISQVLPAQIFHAST